MVKAHTKRIVKSREENDQNVQMAVKFRRSDMVTGVSANSIPTSNSQQPRRTLPTPVVLQTRGRTQSFNEPQMDDVMTEIKNLRTTVTDGVIKPKILQTQIPLFRGNQEEFSELEKSPKHAYADRRAKTQCIFEACSGMTSKNSGKC